MKKYWKIGDTHEECGLIPEYILKKQRAWRRRRSVYSLRNDHGLTYAEIARLLNLSRERVRQIEAIAAREVRMKKSDPITVWIRHGYGQNSNQDLALSIYRKRWHRRRDIAELMEKYK